jgi:hypothetical protein
MSQHAIAKAPGHTPNGRGKIRRSLIFLGQRTNNAEIGLRLIAAVGYAAVLFRRMALQRHKLSDPAHEERVLQP